MIVCCGEALFDIFIESESAKGVLDLTAHPGGSPFNVAIGISRLGGESALLTGISDDMLGDRLAAALRQDDVATNYLVRSGRRTTLSLVGVDAAGQPAYMFYGLGSADCNLNTEDLPIIGPEVAGLHFGSYSLVVQPVADAFLTLLDRAGDRFISVDPNVRPTVEPDLDIWRMRVRDYAARAHLLKISTEDMATLYPGTAAEKLAADWIDGGTGLVVVTGGGDSVRGWTRSGIEVALVPPRVDVIDTVGAGDTFQAALLARLAQTGGPGPISAIADLDERSLRELLDFASRAAAVTCGRQGADLPKLADLPPAV